MKDAITNYPANPYNRVADQYGNLRGSSDRPLTGSGLATTDQPVIDYGAFCYLRFKKEEIDKLVAAGVPTGNWLASIKHKAKAATVEQIISLVPFLKAVHNFNGVKVAKMPENKKLTNSQAIAAINEGKLESVLETMRTLEAEYKRESAKKLS